MNKQLNDMLILQDELVKAKTEILKKTEQIKGLEFENQYLREQIQK